MTTTSTPPRSSNVESIESGVWSINVNVLSRFFSLFSVLWASDNKYRLLSAVTKWVQDTHFHNVMAEATVKEGAIFSAPVGCSKCAERLRTSDIVTQIEAVAVGDSDLTHIVSCRLKKSMCLKHHSRIGACLSWPKVSEEHLRILFPMAKVKRSLATLFLLLGSVIIENNIQ